MFETPETDRVIPCVGRDKKPICPPCCPIRMGAISKDGNVNTADRFPPQQLLRLPRLPVCLHRLCNGSMPIVEGRASTKGRSRCNRNGRRRCRMGVFPLLTRQHHTHHRHNNISPRVSCARCSSNDWLRCSRITRQVCHLWPTIRH